MSKKHPANHFKNQENFIKISVIFSNTKNLSENRQKFFSSFRFFLEISQNHAEAISRFLYSFSAMLSILP